MGVILGSLALSDICRLKVFENEVLRKIFRSEKEEIKEAGKKFIINSFIVCILKHILFGPSSRGE
jgi:hypothetical protein